MPLKIVTTPRGCRISGQKKAFLKYEKDIQSGKIPCPFTLIEFKNTSYGPSTGPYNNYYKGAHFPILWVGNVVCSQPIPLKPDGETEILLF